MISQPRSNDNVKTISDRDRFGSVLAQDIQEAEHGADAYLGALGQALVTFAAGRRQAGTRAVYAQPALERYVESLKLAVASRGCLLEAHAAAAVGGRRARIDWTVLGGPTEPTPTEPEVDGPGGGKKG